jgi:hypothetical protein
MHKNNILLAMWTLLSVSIWPVAAQDHDHDHEHVSVWAKDAFKQPAFLPCA